MMAKLRSGKKLEYGAFVLFIALYCVVTVFHEPWFDEAQAWQIARGASLREILFLIPHYEGHPPLWHLILMLPAKLGVPFEVGLKSVGFLISAASAGLLIFRSRLPRIARLLLPFSFFFFYQYGVIVRPYGLMILLMLILGMNLSQRKQHPWRIAALLGLMCFCSAYGIIISGGIALGIVWELWREKGFGRLLRELLRDPSTLSLCALLLLAVLLILEFMPRPETFYAAYKDRNPFIVCLICALFTFPAECFLTSSGWFSVDRTLLQTSQIRTGELLTLGLIGAILWVLIICSSSKKSLKFLLFPYVLLAFFSARVYFSGHHLGVFFMFFLFWAEFISREEDRFELGTRLMDKIIVKEKDARLLQVSYAVIGIFCLLVPIVWTSLASVHDVKYNYYYSKDVAEFLADNGLTELRVLGSWHEDGSLVPFSEEEEGYVNTVMIGTAVPVNAHLGKNVFFNLNHGDPDRGFIYHRRPTLEESRRDLAEWRSHGFPDVIVGKPDLKLIYGEDLSYREDYSLVALIESKFIWKAGMVHERMPVYLRNSLLEEYHLDALDGMEHVFANGFVITDEMKERYYNGEPVEEILKPYLDAIFGEE